MLGQAATMIRILIVDDHPVVRYGIKNILDAESDIEVVGELDGIDGIETALDRLHPHVVLLDLEMGDVQGAEALRRLREVAPKLHVIVYTSHDEEEYIIQAAEIGVDGYLLKGSPKEEIISAVRCVNEGGTAIESAVAAKLMKHMNKRSAKARQPTISFSRREKQVLELLAGGKTNRDIGETLFISESTVKFHVHAILSKLGATNRTEAVSIAVQQGVITIESGD
jgi:DNA-binding NarL/FixJ family response regulator